MLCNLKQNAGLLLTNMLIKIAPCLNKKSGQKSTSFCSFLKGLKIRTFGDSGVMIWVNIWKFLKVDFTDEYCTVKLV